MYPVKDIILQCDCYSSSTDTRLKQEEINEGEADDV
jgi:hypothetical protein